METTIEQLYEEASGILDRHSRDGWRLAEIFHDLNKAGESKLGIARRVGLADQTVANYIKTWDRRNSTPGWSFGDAFTLAKEYANDPDGATAAQAMRDVGLVKSLTRANIDHQADIRTIAAGIANLPDEQKREVAKELAHDIVVRQAARAEDYKERERQLERISDRPRFARDAEISVIGIRLAVWKAEKTVHDALDGRTSFTQDEREMLTQNAGRLRVLADLLSMYAEGAPDDNAWAEFEESLAGGPNG